MSRADDESLLAMQAANMRVASIAATMGWREDRVERRLAILAERAEAACEPGSHPDDQVERLDGPPPEEPAPVLAAGEGLVMWSFLQSSGAYGAAVVGSSGQLAYADTGKVRLGDGERVALQGDGDRWTARRFTKAEASRA